MPYRALELYCQSATEINEAVQRIVTKKGKERCGSKSDSFSLLFIVSLLSNKTPEKLYTKPIDYFDDLVLSSHTVMFWEVTSPLVTFWLNAKLSWMYHLF